jgi:hypothetical protein
MRLQRSVRTTTIAAACVVVALFAIAPLARAQVLQSVPSDALVVIKFGQLKGTSDKIAAFAKKLGLDQYKPEFADPLGSLKKEGKLTNGLDDNGEAAFYISNQPSQKKGEPPVVLLLPVTDYAAFSGNFQGAKTEGDATVIRFGGNNEDSYMVNWGKYAAIGSTKESVAKKPDGLTVAGDAAKELAEKDIVAYANMKVAREKLLSGISQGRTKFMQNFERGMRQAGQPPRQRPGAPGAGGAAAPNNAAANAQAQQQQMQKYMPVIKALVNRVFDVAEQVVRDADAATYGININGDGIRTTALAEFTAGSPSAQHVSQFKSSNDSMLVGLPQTKYIMFGGVQINSQHAVQLCDQFSAPIKQQAAALGADGQAITSYMDAIKKGMAAITGQSFGWVTPTGALGQEALFQMVAVNHGNADQILATQRDIFNSQQAFMDMFQPPAMKGQVKTTFTDNAKTIDGVSFNQFQTQFTPPPAGQRNPQMMQMQQMMTWLYGPGGMNGYTGKIAADEVVAGVGVNDSVLTQLVASAKAKQDTLSAQAGVASVKQQLPQQRFFAGYFQLDQFATTLANYAKMFGMPINLQLPADLPPIGVTASAQGNSLRGDSYVPAQLIQGLVAAGMQAYMQMQGGQQPGGPGGL